MFEPTSSAPAPAPATRDFASTMWPGARLAGLPLPGLPGASATLLAKMLDVVDFGILLLEDEARISFMNQTARLELDGGHPLQVRHGVLQARESADATALNDALAAALQRGLQRMLRVGSGAGVTITAVPLLDGSRAPAAAILFGKREVCEHLSVQAYARLHHLTPAEAGVLSMLCSGAQPSAIAQARGVKLSSVRSQIGALREKTGCRTIRDLLRDVACLPPLAHVV